MFTQYTYQDWEATPENERPALLMQIIQAYTESDEFRHMLTAQKYLRGENESIAKKVILSADKFETKDKNGKVEYSIRNKEIIGNRVANNFFMRFVVQENMRLLAYGVTLDDDVKEKLGNGFDTLLSKAGEMALVQGVCWCFFNLDHLEIIQAAKDKASGLVALVDEMTGAVRVAAQFWRLSDNRPMYVRLFESEGVTLYKTGKEGVLTVLSPRRAYKQTIRADASGETVVFGENWSFLPVVPLYGNPEQRSELTPSLKAKIDLYDVILSDLGDNLERANSVFWVLNNFGGTTKDAARMVEEINRLKLVMNQSDGVGGGSTAEPRTIEVPYQARQMALSLLKQALYAEFMAVDMEALTGGSLTNVAIKAATSDSNLKTDRYEWCVTEFIRQILLLIGVDTDEISFKRNNISNEKEVIDSIYKCREDIDRRTALEKNPLINNDEIEDIMQNLAAEESTGAPSMPELQKMIDDLNLTREVGEND